MNPINSKASLNKTLTGSLTVRAFLVGLGLLISQYVFADSPHSTVSQADLNAAIANLQAQIAGLGGGQTYTTYILGDDGPSGSGTKVF